MRLCLLLSFIIISSYSIACTCGEVDKITDSDIESAEAVFIGTIISVSTDKTSNKKTAIFEIKKVYKGELTTSNISIKTNLDAGSCGLRFETGQKWYVFARKSTSGTGLHAGLCGRSVQLSNYSKGVKKHIIGRKNLHKLKSRFKQDKRLIRKYQKTASNKK
ncbi:MAG: hypothetical protein P8M05_09000 [Flavobacteriales bacterium]|nr:hypothetical protein [Flavobacteriales bacterium]